MSINTLQVKTNLPLNSTLSLHLNVDTQLVLQEGITGVFGQSGQGKSSLLKVIAGLLPHPLNEVRFDNDASPGLPELNPCVYQEQQVLLFPTMTVEQNLDFVLKHSTWKQKNEFSKQQVVQWCGISSLLNQDVTSLSGGEKQRVSLARSLLSGKPILLLDEPFSALDWRAREELMSLITHLVSEHEIRVVIVSHSLRELALSCHQIVQIENGRITFQGDIKPFLEQAETLSESKAFARLELNSPKQIETFNLSKWSLRHAPEHTVYVKDERKPYSAQSKIIILEADKVSISKQSSEHSSMLNELPANITAIEPKQTNVLVSLIVGQQHIYSEITHYSVNKLKLNIGDLVYVQFKAV